LVPNNNTMAEIDDLLKSIDDVLANENLQTEEEKPDENQDLINQIDAAIEPPKQEAQVKEELPKATPSPLPSPAAAPAKEPEIDLSKPSNQVLSIIGDKDQEDFDAADLELIDGLEDGKDLYELSKARPDISLKTDQARKIFEYQRTASPYTKVPENAADWYNLADAASEDVVDIFKTTGEMVWGGLKGATKAVQYGTPALLGMTSTYSEALALEKMLDPEKRQEVEEWRKRAWQIASTPLKGGEQPNPDAYTDEKYLQKVKENLPPEKAQEAQKTEQEFQEKRYKAKQVPYSILDELAGLPISLNFLGTKVGTGGMQTWDNISEKFGLQDKEKSFENWLARNEIDTAQAKMMKAEPRAFARVVQTYYAPAMKSFTNLLHPSVEEYMIMYPELSREEAQTKRAEQIDSDVQTTIEDIKKDIPETDPDQAMFGSLAIPGQFGLDNFGFAYNVLSATKQLTPLVRTKLRQMRYTDDQINAFEKQAQQALRAKELKRLEKLEKPGMVERAAGATAKGIEIAGDYFERSPTWQKIGKATPVISGAVLGYEINPQNPLAGLTVGAVAGLPAAKFALKTITEIPKSIKEISAARRISAGGAQGPLATLKTIAQQQDEVKTLSAKLKTYAEGTDDYIETEKLLKDAKDKLKGIKAGGTDVIDYQGIGKVSDTTKRILRFVNDDMISNIGEYAKLGVEPTLVGLATGIIDSSDEDELKSMIGQGLAFSLGGRAVQQSFNKFIGEDPVIAARKSRQANVDAFKAYRDSSPETRGEIDQLTDWDNVINRQATKAEQAQIALQELQAKGADPAKIAEAQKAATAEQKSLSLLKTANVQTRNEFGRQFLQQLGRNNMLLNGSLKAGQNNVGFHILSTQQIFDHFRKNPAFNNVPDDVILTYAGQSGFYSGGGQQGESNMAFDPAKPAIVLNSDALRNRMEVFGETPIDALNHETGHHISRVPEIQDALGDVRKILFTNEIKDASGLTKTITNGLYTNDQLVDLFDSQYLKNKSKQEKEQIAKSLGLWDSGLNQLDRENVKNYMQEEILAEVFSNTLSRNLGKNIDDKQIQLLDFARLKLKNNLLKKAAVKMLGLGMDGNVESAVTGAQITPEAQSAARNALRIMQSMNGDFSTITSQPDVPAISKADIKKSRVAAERYGMDSGLFETKTIAQVFDAAGKPIGDAVEITDPAVFEGSWRIGKDGEERLSGYGQVPVELRQLQVPEGGTLSISKQLQTEADGVTPKMLEKGELAKRIKNRAELFKKAIDTPDYGTPGRFEPVYEGSETYRGSFTPMQIQAIKDLPEGIVPLKIKKYLLELNDAIVRKDGTRFFVDYAAVMDDKGNYKAFSPKIYDVVPIGLQLSSAGNFLVTTISVGRMREKLNLWADRMPGRLSPWNGSKEAFWQDFSKKYLANWAAEIEGSGYKNGVPVGNNQLDPDYQKAEEKKSILNDYLNLFTNETRPLNLDRTQIPRKQGDPKNKSADRTIMSMRVDHFAELLSGEHLPKLPIDYGKAIINFSPAPAVEVEAPSGERGFKSKLQTEIQSKFKGANATPEQLKAVVGNPQFVKPEEVKWSGVMDEIDRLAQENKGKVPVQALVNYLRDEGQVKFEEVTLGSTGNNAEKIAEKYGITIDTEYGETTFYDPETGYLEFDELPEELRNELNKVIPKSTAKFVGYQLPGGENYREVVLSMPFSKKGNDLSEKVRIETTENYKGEPIYIIYGPSERFGGETRMSGEFSNLENAQKAFEKIKLKFIGKKESFTSSHFPDVPNYIAHMRVNERTDAEGNQGLFVEELQSDRHQQGREKGYREENEIESIKKLRDYISNPSKNVEKVLKEDYPEWKKEYSKFIDFAKNKVAVIESKSFEKIPDAPFRKDWGVQLFKRALRDAVESGKSWIGWTTGETQAERYDLSKQIGKVVWNEDTKMLTAYDPSKKKTVIQESNITSDKLADYVGKEVAQKLVEQSPDDDMDREISGLDLKIGGEGMKGFYDTILPKEIGKYVSKMGGKVDKSGIITETPSTFTQFTRTQNAIPKTIDIPEKVTPIWRVNITPEMENVVRAGQIQFMPSVAVVPERFTGTGEKGEERRGRYVAPPEFWKKFDIDEFERGGKFFDLETGEDVTDKTYATGTINVTGKRPSLVSESIIDEMPLEKGRTWKTNLFRKSAGWNWISENPPEIAVIGTKEKPDPVLISVDASGDHFYTLKAEFPNGVQLARYPDQGNEPRLRPTKKGQIQLGDEVGRIRTSSGKEHPVYDSITIGNQLMPSEQPQGMEGVEAPQAYRRISGMIPPLQGVEPPVRGRVEEPKPALSGLAMPAGQIQFMPAESTSKKSKEQKLKNTLKVRMTRKALTDAALSQESWKDWYKEHQDVLDDFFGDYAELFQEILAVTSQAASVKANVGLALKAFGQLMRGEEFDARLRGEEKGGYLDGVINNLNAIKNKTNVSGRKISNYKAANEGDASRVVVDRHITRLLFGVDTPSKAQYDLAEKILTEIANDIGWEPSQVQAALWAHSIVLSGKKPESYGAYLTKLESAKLTKRELASGLTGNQLTRRIGELAYAGAGSIESGKGRGRYSPISEVEINGVKQVRFPTDIRFMPSGEIPTAKEVLKKPLENLPLREASTWTEIQEAPIITLKDLIGKKVFPTFADITSAGRVFKGIDSSELLIPIETHGGPEWPLIQSEKVGEETNVWSNQGAGVTTTKAKRADEGAIMLVTLMDKNAHMSNTEVANAIIGTNLAYVRDERITANNLKLLNKKIKSEEVFDDFVGIDSPDINDYVSKLPFQGDKSRARLATILSLKESEELGAANVQRILDEMRSPEFEGGRIGDSVIALQLSKGAPVVKLSDSGGMTHPSYQYAVRGKVIGKFARPINAEMIYDDFIAQRRAEGKPQKGDRRAIDLAKPVQVITEQIASRIPQTPYKYLKSAQHAKLLKYALENKWKDSGTAKNKGGISPAEFIDTLNSSEAKVALNDYTLDSVKKEIKDGKLNLYQLGDSKVFFGTKNTNPASDYGLDPKDYGFGENEKTLTLVLNAERGTAGMGDAIMMKALSEGVTALDCFAIKNSRYPDGMLPSLYKRFGFEVVGEIPFDPQYYTPQKLEDIKLFWKNNGWDESTGLPSVVLMKWKGNENDRTGTLRDIAGKSPTGIRERTELVVENARRDSERTDIGQSGVPQGGLQQGESGRGGGSAGDAVQRIQLGRGTINAIQELLGMNDAELKNLGIDPTQIKAIKKAVGMSQ